METSNLADILLFCVYTSLLLDELARSHGYLVYSSVSQTFFKWGPLSLVRMFYGPPYSWDYQTH